MASKIDCVSGVLDDGDSAPDFCGKIDFSVGLIAVVSSLAMPVVWLLADDFAFDFALKFFDTIFSGFNLINCGGCPLTEDIKKVSEPT